MEIKLHTARELREARLPYCLPVDYTDAAGRHCLAYPRSPWAPARYIVERMLACSGDAAPTDLECVHDDFGTLVPMRERTLSDNWATSACWRPVAPGGVAA